MSGGTTRLLFGSGNSQDYSSQPLWNVMSQRGASIFAWAGNAVYADNRVGWKSAWLAAPIHKTQPTRVQDITNAYVQQRSIPEFQHFLTANANISIVGALDDHNYGGKDRTFEWKRESASEYVRFLGLDNTTAIYQRAVLGKGVYGVQFYDFTKLPGEQLLSDQAAGLDPDVVPVPPTTTAGEISPKTVAIWILDVRSHKTPFPTKPSQRYKPDKSGQILGVSQWTWFEEAISRSNAAVNIIVQGFPVHAYNFLDGNSLLGESWSNYPYEQQRLYQAIMKSNAQIPILISGHVDLAQYLRKDCQQLQNVPGSQQMEFSAGTTRPLLELTTSGMTHSWGTRNRLCSRPQSSIFCRISYLAFVFRAALRWQHDTAPWNSLVVDDNNIKRKLFSLDLNFAEIEVDWNQQQLQFQWLGAQGQSLMSSTWSFSAFSQGNVPTKTTNAEYVRTRNKLFAVGSGKNDTWICVPYRGLADPKHLAFSTVNYWTTVFFFTVLPIWPCVILGLCFVRKRNGWFRHQLAIRRRRQKELRGQKRRERRALRRRRRGEESSSSSCSSGSSDDSSHMDPSSSSSDSDDSEEAEDDSRVGEEKEKRAEKKADGWFGRVLEDRRLRRKEKQAQQRKRALRQRRREKRRQEDSSSSSDDDSRMDPSSKSDSDDDYSSEDSFAGERMEQRPKRKGNAPGIFRKKEKKKLP